MFFNSWSQASFTRSQSSLTSLFCHANIREGNFFESENEQRAYLLHVRKMQNVCFI